MSKLLLILDATLGNDISQICYGGFHMKFAIVLPNDETGASDYYLRMLLETLPVAQFLLDNFE